MIFLCITGVFQPSIHALAWPLAVAVCFSRAAVAWSLRFEVAMSLAPGTANTSRPVGARPPRLRSKASVTEKSGLDDFSLTSNIGKNFRLLLGRSVCFCSFLSTSEDDPTRAWFLSFTCVFFFHSGTDVWSHNSRPPRWIVSALTDWLPAWL